MLKNVRNEILYQENIFRRTREERDAMTARRHGGRKLR